MGLHHWRMIPYLSAILGAREVEAWGRPLLKLKILKAGALPKTK